MGGRGALLAGWASLVVALLIVAILARRRGRTLDEVARGVAALGEGRPARMVHAWAGGAAGRLAQVFNEVAPRLERHVDQLEGDRQLLRAVLGGMTEGVVAFDARRRLLFANDAAGRLFGLNPDAVGRLVAEVIRIPQVHHAVVATLSGSGPFRDEIIVPGPVGWTRGPSMVLAVHGTPLPGSPAPGAVLVFHDVTETRRLERVRQDFVANASHELKTPLASIKAYTETLLEGALHDDDVNAKFLLRIDEQAERLNRLILDLLSLARLESGQDYFQHGPLELAPVVRRSAEAQAARAGAKGLDLRLELADGAGGIVVEADEEAIRQILDNLIDNAIKYTTGSGTVRVVLRPADGGEAILEVVDTGIGIPRDDLPRVFERFYRVDKARSRELGGTGLGLSIVKHLVQSLGGQIAVDSRLGRGSTFTVRLPPSRPGRPEEP